MLNIIPQQQASADERTLEAIESLRPKLVVTFYIYLFMHVPIVINSYYYVRILISFVFFSSRGRLTSNFPQGDLPF